MTTSLSNAHEKLLARAIQLFLGVLVIARIAMNWRKHYIDLRYFVETARLILQGISPYHPETNPTPYIHPLQSPSMSFLSMPLCFTSELFQNALFFIGSSLTFVAFTVMVFNYYGFSPKRILEPRLHNIPIWLTFTLIFISSPFLGLLRHGQNSCFAVFLLFLALFYPKRDKGANIIFLGLAAAFKYSLLTMQVPVLVFQKRWRLCFFSVSLFLVLLLSVGFWLDGIIPALMDYIRFVISNTQQGNNSYAGGLSYNLVSIGFFRHNFLNIIAKVLVLILYFLTLRKIWIRGQKESGGANRVLFFPERLTALEWATFTVLTMIISYHREYDGVLFLPFIGVVFIELLETARLQGKFKRTNLVCLSVLAFLLLFWAVPQSCLYSIEAFVGRMFPMGKSFLYYSSFGVHTGNTMFPIIKIVMLCTVFFLFAMELFPFFDNQINRNPENDQTT